MHTFFIRQKGELTPSVSTKWVRDRQHGFQFRTTTSLLQKDAEITKRFRKQSLWQPSSADKTVQHPSSPYKTVWQPGFSYDTVRNQVLLTKRCGNQVLLCAKFSCNQILRTKPSDTTVGNQILQNEARTVSVSRQSQVFFPQPSAYYIQKATKRFSTYVRRTKLSVNQILRTKQRSPYKTVWQRASNYNTVSNQILLTKRSGNQVLVQNSLVTKFYVQNGLAPKFPLQNCRVRL